MSIPTMGHATVNAERVRLPTLSPYPLSDPLPQDKQYSTSSPKKTSPCTMKRGPHRPPMHQSVFDPDKSSIGKSSSDHSSPLKDVWQNDPNSPSLATESVSKAAAIDDRVAGKLVETLRSCRSTQNPFVRGSFTPSEAAKLIAWLRDAVLDDAAQRTASCERTQYEDSVCDHAMEAPASPPFSVSESLPTKRPVKLRLNFKQRFSRTPDPVRGRDCRTGSASDYSPAHTEEANSNFRDGSTCTRNSFETLDMDQILLQNTPAHEHLAMDRQAFCCMMANPKPLPEDQRDFMASFASRAQHEQRASTSAPDGQSVPFFMSPTRLLAERGGSRHPEDMSPSQRLEKELQDFASNPMHSTEKCHTLPGKSTREEQLERDSPFRTMRRLPAETKLHTATVEDGASIGGAYSESLLDGDDSQARFRSLLQSQYEGIENGTKFDPVSRTYTPERTDSVFQDDELTRAGTNTAPSRSRQMTDPIDDDDFMEELDEETLRQVAQADELFQRKECKKWEQIFLEADLQSEPSTAEIARPSTDDEWYSGDEKKFRALAAVSGRGEKETSVQNLTSGDEYGSIADTTNGQHLSARDKGKAPVNHAPAKSPLPATSTGEATLVHTTEPGKSNEKLASCPSDGSRIVTATTKNTGKSTRRKKGKGKKTWSKKSGAVNAK